MAIFRGGPGNDRLVGTSGADELIGFAGDDLLAGGAGADILNGGVGMDTAGYYTSNRGVRADLSDPGNNTGDARGDTYVGIERLLGSREADELRGGMLNSVLLGRAGNDTLIGQFATTVLIGGTGADTLIGQGISTIAGYSDALAGVTVHLAKPARNTGDAAGDIFDNINGLEGSGFADRLTGDKRDNVLSGLAGDDRLTGGKGNDQLLGGAGADELNGGKGFDTVGYGGALAGLTVDLLNPDASTGDAAGDTFKDIEGVEGSQFADRLMGDKLENFIVGGMGNDRIKGRGGDDTLQGGFGDDRVYGGGGDDSLSGGFGADRLKGGGGLDKAVYLTATSGLTVDLHSVENNTGLARGDTFSGVEGIDGSNFSDNLSGDEADNWLFGRDGGDLLKGRDGDDRLFGGRNDDQLRGADGNDTLVGGDGADKLSGGDGIDTASYILATAGVVADLANSTANAGEAAGDTYARVENLAGSGFADVLRGDGGANRINAGNGDDRLEGGAGNDTLIGGEGRDILTGGAGADIFLFTTTPSPNLSDEIVDFQIGEDLVGLARAQFGRLPAGELSELAFHSGATATEASQRILHDSATGDILFDADGAGGVAAVRFAQLTAGLVLDAGDFLMV